MARSNKVAELRVEFTGVITKLNEACDRAEKRLEAFSKSALKAGDAVATHITAPSIAAGAVLITLSERVAKAEARLRIMSGRTGADLEGLTAQFRELASESEHSMTDIAQSMGILSKRSTGAAGELGKVTDAILEASDMMGEQATPNAVALGKVLEAWDRPLGQADRLLDMVFSQVRDGSGTMQGFQEDLVGSKDVLSALNLSLEESIALIGQLQHKGIAVADVSSGLRRFAVNASQLNIDPRSGLNDVIGRIRKSKSDIDALTIAAGNFGEKAAVSMVLAIRSGALELTHLAEASKAPVESVRQLGHETDTFADKLAELGNRISIKVSPAGDKLIEMLTRLEPAAIALINSAGEAASAFAGMSDEQSRALAGAAGLVVVFPVAARSAALLAENVRGISVALVGLTAFEFGAWLEDQFGIASHVLLTWESLIRSVAIEAEHQFARAGFAMHRMVQELNDAGIARKVVPFAAGMATGMGYPALGDGVMASLNVQETQQEIIAAQKREEEAYKKSLASLANYVEDRRNMIFSQVQPNGLKSFGEYYGSSAQGMLSDLGSFILPDLSFGKAADKMAEDMKQLSSATSAFAGSSRDSAAATELQRMTLEEAAKAAEALKKAEEQAAEERKKWEAEATQLRDRFQPSAAADDTRRKVAAAMIDFPGLFDKNFKPQFERQMFELELAADRTFAGKMTNAVYEWRDNFVDALDELRKTGNVSFEDLANSFESMLFKMAMSELVVQPLLQGIIGGARSYFGGTAGQSITALRMDAMNIGGLGHEAVTSPFDGAKAAGGDVSAGSMYLVGEQGPELFSPSQDGFIFPHGAAIGMPVGGGGVTVQVIDQRGSGAKAQVTETTGPDGQRMIQVLIRDELNKAFSDGSADQALAANYGIWRRPGRF